MYNVYLNFAQVQLALQQQQVQAQVQAQAQAQQVVVQQQQVGYSSCSFLFVLSSIQLFYKYIIETWQMKIHVITNILLYTNHTIELCAIFCQTTEIDNSSNFVIVMYMYMLKICSFIVVLLKLQ